MPQKQGLEIYKADGTLLFDLTSRIPKYLGELDIYPASPNAECEGSVAFPSITNTWSSTYSVVDKVYASGIGIYGSVAYILPAVSVRRINGVMSLYWHYRDYVSYNYSQQVNLPVRVRFGVF